MTKAKELSKEEKEKAREDSRQISLKNLKASNLQNLAIAYLADQKDSGYGENDNSAVEEFLYFPALNSGAKVYNFETGEEVDLIRNSLLSSRQGGKRYSGQVSEYGIIETSANIIQKSLAYIKAGDVMELIGSTAKIKDAYKEKYLGDLINSANEDEKKIGMTLAGSYMNYITSQGVSKSLSKKSEQIRGGLEKILAEDKAK